MAKLSIVAGSTSKLIDVFIQDTSVTTGAGLTGLVFNTTSLVAYYYREGAASAVKIDTGGGTALVTMTLGTWVSCGFIVVDGTNMPGCYQLGIPNAAIAAGAKSVMVMMKGATNMAPLLLEIELTVTDNQTATLTAAQIATGVWQDTTANDFTTSASVGKSVMNGVALGTGLTVNAVTGMTASDVNAIKLQTDKLTFTVTNQLDANIQYVNDVQVNGVGTAGSPWGP